MTQQRVYFNSRDKLIRLDIQKIVYFEGDGNYTYIITANKQIVCVTMNLSHTEDALASQLGDNAKQFMRIGRLNQKCKGKAINHQYHILYEQNKPKNKVNDEVHHLLRHLRNAIAHGRIRKKGSKLFQFSDETPDGNGVTMIGEIDYKLFFELIDLAKKT